MTLVLEARHDVERVVAPRLPRVDRFPTRLVILAMVGSAALRARFITTPLSADEGGYLAVARAWASGKALYTEAWVDRPQGLLLLFRFWDRLTGGSAEAIRVMAILFGCLAVAAVAYIVFAVAGQRAAGVASILVAVASANARIEGFIANGELLAGAIAAAGVAAACAHLFRGRGQSWLFVSGVLAGCAMSIKQSGFDGFLAVMVCVVAGGLTGERTWRQALRECALCVAGLVTVLSGLVIHGIFLGFSSWWYAVAGYRIGGINATDGDWSRFSVTGLIAAPTIVPLLVAAILGLVAWLARDRRITRSKVLLPAWVCFACLAFVTGGLFHRHYWVTLTFPLAAAAAVGIASCRRLRINGRMLIAVTCLLALPSLISTAHVIVLDRSAAALVAHDDPRLEINEQVGKWYREHRTSDSTLYALCASAPLYAYADATPPYPYLWLDGVQHGRGAQTQLVELFSGDHPPTYVVQYQSVAVCNPSGRVAALLYQRYDIAANVAGARILALRDGAANQSLSDRSAFSAVT
jgi:hypothetical protein